MVSYEYWMKNCRLVEPKNGVLTKGSEHQFIIDVGDRNDEYLEIYCGYEKSDFLDPDNKMVYYSKKKWYTKDLYMSDVGKFFIKLNGEILVTFYVQDSD